MISPNLVGGKNMIFQKQPTLLNILCITDGVDLSRSRLVIFRHIIYNMEGKLSTQMVHFFYPMFANCVHILNRCTFTFGKFLKTIKCSSGQVECSFDNRAEVFYFVFEKKTFFFSKSVKVANSL